MTLGIKHEIGATKYLAANPTNQLSNNTLATHPSIYRVHARGTGSATVLIALFTIWKYI